MTIWSIQAGVQGQFRILGSAQSAGVSQIAEFRDLSDFRNAVLPRKSLKTTVRAENEAAILAAAEAVFAEFGFKGASTSEIARRANVPKPNLHYYFPTKEALYRVVLQRVLTVWLDAGASMDENAEPESALRRYIGMKMDLSRSMTLGSQIWASEIMRGAPIIKDFLETTLKDWVAGHEIIVQRWHDEGKIHPVSAKALFFMIWATTQHYADFATQIACLNAGQPLSDAQFNTARAQVTEMIVRGVVRAAG